jgi:hypothetical protein
VQGKVQRVKGKVANDFVTRSAIAFALSCTLFISPFFHLTLFGIDCLFLSPLDFEQQKAQSQPKGN